MDADSLIDWPICDWFHLLADHYPAARFILTFRPPHDCAFSWVRMTNAQPGKHDGALGYADFAHYAQRHVDEVIERFRRDPRRLLLLDMRDTDETKWKLLCGFLGKPVPAGAFPREFCHDEWQTDPTLNAEMRG